MWIEDEGLGWGTQEKEERRKLKGTETQRHLNLFQNVLGTLYCQTEHGIRAVSMERSMMFPGES